jgi:UDPglucose--hexose-1-phosphate uridylyltransferase
LPDLRIDPLSGTRVIVAGERGERPGAFPGVEPAAQVDPEKDPFLDGHEDRTPPELYALRPGGGPPDSPGWAVRVVPNLYPALSERGDAGDAEPVRDPLAVASRSCSLRGRPRARTR